MGTSESDVANAPPLAVPTPTSAPFWDALKRETILIQFCVDCERWIFYPRSHCPACLGTQLDWREVAGVGRIHTFTVAHQPTAPQFAADAPQVLAIVELDEGLRLTSTIVAADTDSLEVGSEVRPVFEHHGDGPTLLRFRPA